MKNFKKFNEDNNPFNTMLLDITKVNDAGDAYERSLQNWLKDNDIWWSQRGSNLNFITIHEHDFEKIKNSLWEPFVA